MEEELSEESKRTLASRLNEKTTAQYLKAYNKYKAHIADVEPSEVNLVNYINTVKADLSPASLYTHSSGIKHFLLVIGKENHNSTYIAYTSRPKLNYLSTTSNYEFEDI